MEFACFVNRWMEIGVMAKLEFEGAGSLAQALESDMTENEMTRRSVTDELHQVIERAKKEANEHLREYGNVFSYEVEPVIDSATVKSHERRGKFALTLEWIHEAASFFDKGTEAHVIEGDPLAFEWPDAPPDIRKKFEETFPTIFMQKVHVKGIPPARFTEQARRVADTVRTQAGGF